MVLPAASASCRSAMLALSTHMFSLVAIGAGASGAGAGVGGLVARGGAGFLVASVRALGAGFLLRGGAGFFAGA